MEIPHRGARPVAFAPPEIRVQESNFSDRIRNMSRTGSYNANTAPANIPGPMSIPNARDPVPPPLPPPRHLADIEEGGHNGPDIAWQWGNSHEDNDWGKRAASVALGSSLYGSFASGKSIMDERPDQNRRTSSTSTIKPLSGGDGKGIGRIPESMKGTQASLGRALAQKG